MEFNVLPKSKFLSLSPRNTHQSNQTTNQTVNVILPREQTNEEKPKIVEHKEAETEPGEVHYTQREVKLDDSNESKLLREPAEQLSPTDSISTINFLKLVVKAYMNNPLKYNGYIICSVPDLENIIETLTECDDCQIDIEDSEIGCCGNRKVKITPISKIWVRNKDTSEIFKYRYSPFLQTFEEYRISLKFVYQD